MVKTILRVSETDGDGSGVATLLSTFDDTLSSNRGTLMIRKIGAPGVFIAVQLNGTMEDAGAYDNFPVLQIQSAGALSNEDPISVEVYRNGEKGETGPAGPGSSDNKESVRVATPTNVTISSALLAGSVIDGVVLASGNRVLVANQTTKSENGIYVVGGSPTRATDADAAGELSGGTTVRVEEGTIYSGRSLYITTPGSITPGTTNHSWAVTEPKDFGLVTELPTSKALVGDTAHYWADKTEGVIWDLIFTNENGQMPWNALGTTPLYDSVVNLQSTASTTFTNLAIAGPSITVPLQGDYDVEISAFMQNSTVTSTYMSYSIGGAAVDTSDGVFLQAFSGGGHFTRTRRKTGIATGTEFVTKYKVSSGTGSFQFRTMRITPIRVG